MSLKLVVHATHEAGVKVGGIGAVLDGLLASRTYNDAIDRSILIGSYQADDPLEQERLHAPRNQLTVRYHTREKINRVPEAIALAFHRIQQQFGVSILYGHRRFGSHDHEVLLVDGTLASPEPVNEFKGHLYARYGIQSDRYEGQAEFDRQMDIAPAAIAALRAVLGTAIEQPAFFIAHEWLGVPTMLATEFQLPGQFRRIFYAHETATVRPIVEDHPGHDLRFYNVMRVARENGLSLEQIFGDQRGFFKHALMHAALYVDGVFAVGDLVKEELEFLEPALIDRTIDLIYNGVPSESISAEEKQRSTALLQQYASELVGFTPSWLFSHVTRLIPSKGIWRDIRVMERLDQILAEEGETAVLFLLSTIQPAGRRGDEVRQWEKAYGWPVYHRTDNGDLIGYEVDYYRAIEQFNNEARASRIIFVNQFGWSRDRCGERMPAEMEFKDLRQGTNLEFGQSIYEPFGIAQVEPLGYGALCLVSTACGCLGFISDRNGLELPNVLVGDYLYLPAWAGYRDLLDILRIGQGERDAIETMVADQIAKQIADALPRSEELLTQYLETGYDLSTHMSWEVVNRDYLLPALRRIAGS